MNYKEFSKIVSNAKKNVDKKAKEKNLYTMLSIQYIIEDIIKYFINLNKK